MKKNKQRIQKTIDRFSEAMNTKIFRLQVTPEIRRSMFWWCIFKPKRLIYFMHLHVSHGYAVRPAYDRAVKVTRKNLIQQLKDAGYYK